MYCKQKRSYIVSTALENYLEAQREEETLEPGTEKATPQHECTTDCEMTAESSKETFERVAWLDDVEKRHLATQFSP